MMNAAAPDGALPRRFNCRTWILKFFSGLKKKTFCPAVPRRGPEAGSPLFTNLPGIKNIRFLRENHSVIFLIIRPSRKTVIPPPLWETTIPTAFVTLVMAAAELCRVPIPGGRVTLLESTVI
jgi:hypothetical protein